MNTSATKMLFTILKKLDNTSTIKKINIKWYFEEDDEDHYDTGLDYEDSLDKCKFEFYPITESLAA